MSSMAAMLKSMYWSTCSACSGHSARARCIHSRACSIASIFRYMVPMPKAALAAPSRSPSGCSGVRTASQPLRSFRRSSSACSRRLLRSSPPTSCACIRHLDPAMPIFSSWPPGSCDKGAYLPQSGIVISMAGGMLGEVNTRATAHTPCGNSEHRATAHTPCGNSAHPVRQQRTPGKRTPCSATANTGKANTLFYSSRASGLQTSGGQEMSGGRAARSGSKAPADDHERRARAQDKTRHEDEASRMDEARAALIWGFLPWLRQAFPDRWDLEQDQPVNTMGQILADIAYVSGYTFAELCCEPSDSHGAWKQAFDAFGAEHKMQESCIAFHGSSWEAVEAIHEYGFDPQRCKEGAYGNGEYVSQLLSVALAYATPDKDGLLWAVYGRAHLGEPQEIAVGSRGQTDFGVRADGTRHVTLTNPQRTYWCLSEPRRQFFSNGFVGFWINTEERPSDFALLNMLYPRRCGSR
jgi:hypothetical protein